MAGFGKAAVIAALESRFALEAKRIDALHEKQVDSWEKRRAAIQLAKKNVRQAVRDLVNEKITVEAFSKRLVDSEQGFRGDGWLRLSVLTIPERPVREVSPNEDSIRTAIELVKSVDGDSLTVTEMKTLGILHWVKV